MADDKNPPMGSEENVAPETLAPEALNTSPASDLGADKTARTEPEIMGPGAL